MHAVLHASARLHVRSRVGETCVVDSDSQRLYSDHVADCPDQRFAIRSEQSSWPRLATRKKIIACT